MVEPLLSVREVVRLAVLIRRAAETVRRNREACVRLTEVVNLLHAIVEPLEDMDMSWTPGLRAALTSLEGALLRGHSLVTACQRERNFIYILFTARRLSNRLLKVKDDINAQIKIAHFAVSVTVLVNIRHSQRFLHPPPLEGYGVVMGSSNISGGSFSMNFVGIDIVKGNNDAPKPSRLRIFRPSELKAATNNFCEENVIGKDGSVTVYKGVLPDELVVTIKRYPDKSGKQRIKQYIHVFQLLLEHENIVKFLGFTHVDGSEMVVVEEYMPNGSLFEIINGSSQKLDWLSTFRVIRGVAKGVAYLHSKHVIHLDLNPANIVFDSSMNPKISTVERSKVLDGNVADAVSHELVGTLGYMAPEYLADGRISVKNDVFGLGVLLLHSISGMRSSLHDKHPITWAWEVREAQGMNGLLDFSCSNEHLLEIKRCMEIGLLCTQEFPEDRPTMPDVLEFLNRNEMLPTPKKPCFI